MFRVYAVLLTLLALAGCSSVEASEPKAAVAATPSLPCSLPYGTNVALVAPKPGSRDVPRGSSLVLVASHDLPKTVAAVTSDAKDGTTAGGLLQRTARPSGAAPAPFPNPVYYRATGVTLHAHRNYAVALDDLAQNGCAPYAQISGDPRFST
jgi:hypothetical protein